jgi:osmotically-inducible protein OsmY
MARTKMAWLAVAALSLAQPAFAADDPDAWVTTKVKMALLTTPDVDSLDIHVDTNDGRVTLYGKTSTAAERTRAEQAATGIHGVHEIRNLIQVVPDSARKALEAPDQDVEKRVDQALDKTLPSGHQIDVKNVTNGVVVLDGKAGTLTEHYQALAAANRVDGVRSVKSEIESPDKLADREIWYEGTGELAPGEQGFRDAYITSTLKMKLLVNSDTPALDVNVDSTDGVVTLFGMVPSDAAKRKAGELAKSTRWVHSVDNELQVVPQARQEEIGEKDDLIAKRVEDALKARESLKNADIDVQVSNRVARLTGEVPSQSARYSALLSARGTRGVTGVVDDLRIEPPAVSSGPPADRK